jgi:hypothetical protein
MEVYNNAEKHLYKIEERVITLKTNQYQFFNNAARRIDNLLQKMDAA